MSLSSEQRNSAWGTIFMGPGSSRETTLERVEAGGPSLAWTTDTEAEYLARVKEKATGKAKEILVTAQAEAAALRENAYAQGYEAGLAQAQAELEEFRQGMGASVAAVLAAIEGNAGHIAAAWRRELVALLRQCVETAVNHELSTQRAALLAGLFDGAVAKMEAAQRIVILVHPEDEPAVADMVDAAGQTDDRVFVVRGDASLAPGSLVLESEDSRADNSLTVRRALVENILAQLTVPADAPDQIEGQIEDQAEAQMGFAAEAEVEPPALQDLPEMMQAAPVIEDFTPETVVEAVPETMAETLPAPEETVLEEVVSEEAVLEEQAAPEVAMTETTPGEMAMPEPADLPDQAEAAPAAEEIVAEEIAPETVVEAATEEIAEEITKPAAPEELAAQPPAPAPDENSGADPFELAQAMLEQNQS